MIVENQLTFRSWLTDFLIQTIAKDIELCKLYNISEHNDSRLNHQLMAILLASFDIPRSHKGIWKTKISSKTKFLVFVRKFNHPTMIPLPPQLYIFTNIGQVLNSNG